MVNEFDDFLTYARENPGANVNYPFAADHVTGEPLPTLSKIVDLMAAGRMMIDDYFDPMGDVDRVFLSPDDYRQMVDEFGTTRLIPMFPTIAVEMSQVQQNIRDCGYIVASAKGKIVKIVLAR